MSSPNQIESESSEETYLEHSEREKEEKKGGEAKREVQKDTNISNIDVHNI